MEYYAAFDNSKAFWPDIAKQPRFSWDVDGVFVNDKGFILTSDEPWILGLLQSRVQWFCISQRCVPLRLRGGLWQYQCKKQFMERLPIPSMSREEKDCLSELAVKATQTASDRYQLHESVRHRIRTDLHSRAGKLNQKLHDWWTLDFGEFRTEVRKALKASIPVNERSDWEKALGDWQNRHHALTDVIVECEEELNDRVCRLFKMSRKDIALLDEHARHAMIDYSYGEP